MRWRERRTFERQWQRWLRLNPDADYETAFYTAAQMYGSVTCWSEFDYWGLYHAYFHTAAGHARQVERRLEREQRAREQDISGRAAGGCGDQEGAD